jgi:uncharacterized protein YecE (DUF72 family)
MSERKAQRDLFDLPAPGLAAAAPRPEHAALAARLPPGVRMGTMSWAFSGWEGIVYAPGVAKKRLAAEGLGAYVQHPLLRAVEIDRSYYEPLPAAALAAYAAQAPDDFRFLVKAHEDCTVARFPPHPRYGAKRGQANPRFLDAAYAADQVVAPFVAGLGVKAGALIFQFAPQELEQPAAFPGRLHDFLRRLPRGPTYAVELRNAELLTPAYGQALAGAGAVHCHNVWAAMPPVLAQARQLPADVRRPLIVRWLLRHGDAYEDARDRYAPFDRIRDEDPHSRADVAALVARASQHGVPSFIAINNKAEGCSPESIVRLAAAIADRLDAR